MNLLDSADHANSDEVVRNDEEIETSVDDAWFICQRLEKGLIRMNRNGDGSGTSTGGGGDKAAEHEILQKKYRRLKKEYEDKNKEVKMLRGNSK